MRNIKFSLLKLKVKITNEILNFIRIETIIINSLLLISYVEYKYMMLTFLHILRYPVRITALAV